MNKRILVVDDEKPLANALVLKLSHSGFEVEAVYDGEEAIEKLSKNKYDLALLDLVMPKMNGFSVLEKLKSDGNKTTVIVSSNLSQPEDFEKAKSLGAKDFFVKSDTPISDIVEKINKLLE